MPGGENKTHENLKRENYPTRKFPDLRYAANATLGKIIAVDCHDAFPWLGQVSIERGNNSSVVAVNEISTETSQNCASSDIQLPITCDQACASQAASTCIILEVSFYSAVDFGIPSSNSTPLKPYYSLTPLPPKCKDNFLEVKVHVAERLEAIVKAQIYMYPIYTGKIKPFRNHL